MDRIKKGRKPLRTTITRLANDVTEELAKEDKDATELQVLKDRLTETLEQVSVLDQQLLDLMLDDDDIGDKEMESEMKTIEDYRTKVARSKTLINQVLNPPLEIPKSTSADGDESTSSKYKRNFKLPKIELIKFTGKITDWLAFWSQFQKIDGDEDLHDSDKFHYLLQAIEDGTEARDIVESYPQSSDNYSKAVAALRSRYGRPELLVQVYVRELLKLVIGNVTAKEKLPLSKLQVKLESHLRALESLKLEDADPSTWLFPLVESSLPEEILKAWQRSSLSKEDTADAKDGMKKRSQLTRLLEFIAIEVKSEQQIELARSGFEEVSLSDKRKPINSAAKKKKSSESDVPTAAGLLNQQANRNSCVFCDKSNHGSSACRRASSMTLDQRRAKVREKNACFVCLKPGHPARSCSSGVKCQTCGRRHHTLLCQGTEGQASGQSDQTFATQANVQCSKNILLQTIPVRIWHSRGMTNPTTVRVMFDSGSQRSFITKKAAEKIMSNPLRVEPGRSVMFDGSCTQPVNYNVHEVKMSLDRKYNPTVKLELREVPTIGGKIPLLPRGPWIDELREKRIFVHDVADSEPSSEVDVLIGSDYWGRLLKGAPVQLKSGLTAINTLFGWTIVGPVPMPGQSKAEEIISMYLSDDVSQLWSLEVLGIMDPIAVKSKKEQEEEAMRSFQKNVTRLEQNKYEVGLPWIDGLKQLPTNRNVAEKRLMSTVKKLKDIRQLETYDAIIKAWEEEGFTEQVENADEPKSHYLPHHAVFKDSKTTPVRPVFDASCKVKGSPSLNDCLYKGSNNIEDIPVFLHRFRLKKVGVLSDIRKAFQMIDVKEEDRDYLRFLWWEEPGNVQVLRHRRVVFGLICSPFLLHAVLVLHLEGYKGDEEEAAFHLLKSLYVDNCVTSFDRYEEYEQFKTTAVKIMAEAGMELRQWEVTVGDGHAAEDEITSVLGLKWNKVEDHLSVKMNKVELPEKLTRRTLQSIVYRIYDPIGILSPALLQPKLILQGATKKKTSWDKELSEEQRAQFEKWYEEIGNFEQVKVPRRMSMSSDPEQIQIHCFCDASKYAFGCCVFIRSEVDGEVEVQLAHGKARVGPKGEPTIPRMELLACVIGVRLTKCVRESLEMEGVRTVFWSDSTTALSWIERNEEWGTFVHNRVKEIRGITEKDQWRHVPGVQNPADLPSRGCSPRNLLHSKWWEGPAWLKNEESTWPSSTIIPNEEEVNVEMKKSAAIVMTLTDEEVGWFATKFSLFQKNVEVMAWIKRFVNNCRKKKAERYKTKSLTIQELRSAEKDVVRTIQQDAYGNRSIPISVTDASGILCVNTRLTLRKDTEGFRQPMLLPPRHKLVKALIKEVHKCYGHAGTQFLMSKLREKYWIQRGRRAIKEVIRSCPTCRRYASKPHDVDPSPLPMSRVTIGEPFQVTGVDLAGPLYLKDGSKCWIVLYTCAVFRCVSLDLVSSISTEAFINCLERFINWRGRPNTLYSDNGTNFVGARNLFQSLKWKEIVKASHTKQIQWILNPPTAAWWGGFWERLVGSTKELLKKTLGRACLDFEKLRTILTSVESTINERPLTTVTEDEKDLIPLTPALFLRGVKSSSFPEVQQVTGRRLRGEYAKMRNLRELLEARFRSEYLALLVQRASEKKIPSPKIGDIVLVGADNKKRFDWPLGRILEVIPGRDGKARTARVQTAKGELLRPFQRLYPLEVETGEMTEHVQIRRPIKIKTVMPEVEDEPEDQVHEEPEIEVEVEPVTTRSGRMSRKPSRYGSWNK